MTAGGIGIAAGIRLADRRGSFERNEPELQTRSHQYRKRS